MRLEDYALIGDTQTAALVGNDGSIDWLCLPRFDSASCFANLLGTPDHGRWLLAPAGGVRAVRRRYRGNTLVLETEFDTDGGTVRVTDFMPPRQVEPDLVRVVEGVRGRVAMRSELVIAFDYGTATPWVYRHDDGRLRAVAGPDALCLASPVPLTAADRRITSDLSVGEGDRLAFVLDCHPSHR